MKFISYCISTETIKTLMKNLRILAFSRLLAEYFLHEMYVIKTYRMLFNNECVVKDGMLRGEFCE